jgi:hypothetical protein
MADATPDVMTDVISDVMVGILASVALDIMDDVMPGIMRHAIANIVIEVADVVMPMSWSWTMGKEECAVITPPHLVWNVAYSLLFGIWARFTVICCRPLLRLQSVDGDLSIMFVLFKAFPAGALMRSAGLR